MAVDPITMRPRFARRSTSTTRSFKPLRRDRDQRAHRARRSGPADSSLLGSFEGYDVLSFGAPARAPSRRWWGRVIAGRNVLLARHGFRSPPAATCRLPHRLRSSSTWGRLRAPLLDAAAAGRLRQGEAGVSRAGGPPVDRRGTSRCACSDPAFGDEEAGNRDPAPVGRLRAGDVRIGDAPSARARCRDCERNAFRRLDVRGRACSAIGATFDEGLDPRDYHTGELHRALGPTSATSRPKRLMIAAAFASDRRARGLERICLRQGRPGVGRCWDLRDAPRSRCPTSVAYGRVRSGVQRFLTLSARMLPASDESELQTEASKARWLAGPA
jgi:hypothetical protein